MKNKRIGLLTLDSHIYNFGGMLQEYALYKVIEDLGFECEVIDYDVSSELNTFSVKRGLHNLTGEKIIQNVSKRFGKKNDSNDSKTIEYVNSVVGQRNKKFDEFRRELNFSKGLKYPELETVAIDYHAIVCGSDQIWNPDYNIPSFFLDFVRKPTTSIIYAASVGKAQISRRQLKIYNQMIESIDFVSVREKSAQMMFDRSNVKLVLDPTLLISSEKWKRLANTVKQVKQKYVFCYFLETTREKNEATVKYAKENKLEVVSIPYLQGHYNSWDDNFVTACVDVGPIEFLNLILNADFILTDSFHATVFSILFNKEFRVFGRQSGNYNMNTRIETLLSYFDMSRCLIKPVDLEKSLGTVVAKDAKYYEMKNKSSDYLLSALMG